MKKKNILKKIFSLILLAPMFLITGCFGGGDGGLEVPDPDSSGLPIGVDFDGFTHTYNDYPFKGAYVFVDPGSQGVFTDGYDGDKDATFLELLDRQYETLAYEITYRLLSVYGDGTILTDGKEIGFGSTSYNVNISKNQVINDGVGEIPTEIPDKLPLLGKDAITTWTTILLCEDTDPDDIRNNFKLTNAVNGGHPAINDGGEIGFDVTTNIIGVKWNLYSVSELDFDATKRLIKLIIARAVSSVDGTIEEMMGSIDHLGFTSEDYLKVLGAINNSIIGQNALNYDIESKNNLLSTFDNTITASYLVAHDEIILNNKNNLDISYKYYTSEQDIVDANVRTFNTALGVEGSPENTAWLRAHEYKGYDVIVPSIVKSAMGVTMDETDGLTVINKEVSEGVNIYSTLPRAQVLYMDIYTLQGTSKEEVENSQQESENPTNRPNEELGDMETTYDPETDYVKLEKYLPDMNIISIVLLPNEVTGNPNKMVDGQIVPDTTVTVNGFLLGSIDFAISGEEGYNSTIYADFELKAKGKYIKNGEHNFRSDSVEIYGDRIPENDDEAAFNVYTDLLPLDELKEDINKKNNYLIGGYNGSLVENYGLKGTKATTENEGEYTIYKLKTNTDFIGYDENGVMFDGGDNYVKVNFIFSEIFSDEDVGKNENLVDIKVNTLLNLLAFNPEVL